MNIFNNFVICLLSFLPQFFYSYDSPQTKELKSVIAKQSKVLCKRHKMWQIGTGLGTPNGVIHMLGASFQRDNIESLDQARAILVDAGNEFLKAVNSNKIIKPHLVKDPFTIENIEVRLFLYDQKPDDNNNQLRVVSIIDGKLGFYYENINDRKGYSKEVHETYEEAVKKLQNTPISNHINPKKT